MARLIVSLFMFVLASLATAASGLETVKITDRVYALVGPLEQRSEANLGNNATFGFIVTEKGIILIDSGGTLKGAKAIEQKIREVSGQPIIKVINTGGQDHRWFGNAHFIKQGASVYSSAETLADHQARNDQIERMSGWVNNAWQGTEPAYASDIVDTVHDLKFDDLTIRMVPVGPAHTGGEMLVWLPEEEVVFTGDVVYTERMLGVGSQSQHKPWIEAFDKVSELSPKVVVPGHGHPTDLEKAKKDTLDYLVFLRAQVGLLIEGGGEMQDVSSIDQSAFSYLEVYEQIHMRNVQRVFEEMEWE
ncbi:MAG: MBL fold metallo-hydrolase [Neptuniibacter sp.]